MVHNSGPISPIFITVKYCNDLHCAMIYIFFSLYAWYLWGARDQSTQQVRAAPNTTHQPPLLAKRRTYPHPTWNLDAPSGSTFNLQPGGVWLQFAVSSRAGKTQSLVRPITSLCAPLLHDWLWRCPIACRGNLKDNRLSRPLDRARPTGCSLS